MIQIEKAIETDLDEILNLQRLAYQSEAILLNNFSIPPLMQTLDEVQQEFAHGVFLKAVIDGQIIGSVRGYIQDGTLHIGKLIVHPEYRGRGIGTQLLQAIEDACPDYRYELFTSAKSEKNIRLYERQGYCRFAEKQVNPELRFVYLEKADARHE